MTRPTTNPSTPLTPSTGSDGTVGPGPTDPSSGPAVGPDGLDGPNRTARFAWVATGLILVGVVVLVALALTEPTTTTLVTHPPITSNAVRQAVTTVPPSVFDTVGIDAGTPLTPPVVVGGQPPLAAGHRTQVLFVGAEYNAFSVAERWALIVALSRFGTFGAVSDMQSATASVFPAVQTFSFVGYRYTSPYVVLTAVEEYSAVPGADGSFTRIAVPTPAEQALVDRYAPLAGPAGSHPVTIGRYPFVDIGNRVVTATSGFSPAVLVGRARGAVAAGLTDPTMPTTTAIVAAANELTSGICATTGQLPSAVCSSKGVQAADDALGLP